MLKMMIVCYVFGHGSNDFIPSLCQRIISVIKKRKHEKKKNLVTNRGPQNVVCYKGATLSFPAGPIRPVQP